MNCTHLINIKENIQRYFPWVFPLIAVYRFRSPPKSGQRVPELVVRNPFRAKDGLKIPIDRQCNKVLFVDIQLNIVLGFHIHTSVEI